MRVDLLPNNVLVPVGDATVKTADDPAVGADGNFLAEICRALNVDEQEGNPIEENAIDLNSDEPDSKDMSMFMSACLFALQPPNQKLGIDPSLTIPKSKGDSEESYDAANSDLLLFSGSVKTDSEGKNIIADSQSAFDLFDRTFLPLLAVQNQGVQNQGTQNQAIQNQGGQNQWAQNQGGQNQWVQNQGGQNQWVQNQGVQNQGVQNQGVQNQAILNTATDVAADRKTDTKLDSNKLNTSDLDLNLQSLVIPVVSHPIENSKKVELEANGVSDKKGFQTNLANKEALLESAADLITSMPLKSNKPESATTESTPNESQLQFKAIASNERFIPTGETNSTQDCSSIQKDKTISDIRKTSDPLKMNVAKEIIAEIPLADRVNPVNKTAESMALLNKWDGTPESVKSNNSAVDNSQEKFSSMAMNLEQSTGTTKFVSGSEATMPSRSGDLINELAERIQVLLRDGKGEIRIQLKPEHLGKLEIRAESGGNGVIAHITAESGSVKNYLENNLHVLKQSFQDQGIKIDRIQVNVQDFTDSQPNHGQSTAFGQAGSGNQNDESPKHARSVDFGKINPTEEISVDSLNFISDSLGRINAVA
jgi:flagellar hook-length control protein FliK